MGARGRGAEAIAPAPRAAARLAEAYRPPFGFSPRTIDFPALKQASKRRLHSYLSALGELRVARLAERLVVRLAGSCGCGAHRGCQHSRLSLRERVEAKCPPGMATTSLLRDQSRH